MTWGPVPPRSRPAHARAGHRNPTTALAAGGILVIVVIGLVVAQRFGGPPGAIGRLVGLGSSAATPSSNRARRATTATRSATTAACPIAGAPSAATGSSARTSRSATTATRSRATGAAPRASRAPPRPSVFPGPPTATATSRVEASATFDEAATSCAQDGGHRPRTPRTTKWKAITQRLAGGAGPPVGIPTTKRRAQRPARVRLGERRAGALGALDRARARRTVPSAQQGAHCLKSNPVKPPERSAWKHRGFDFAGGSAWRGPPYFHNARRCGGRYRGDFGSLGSPPRRESSDQPLHHRCRDSPGTCMSSRKRRLR